MPTDHNESRKPRPTFFMKRSDRLIARLKHLLYGMRFAKQVDGQMIMAWTPLPTWFEQFDSRDYHVNLIFDIREYYAAGGSYDLIFFDSITPFPAGLLSLQGPEFESMRPSRFDRQFFLDGAPTVYSGVYHGFQFADEMKSLSQLDAEVREIYASLPLDPVVARILAAAKEKMGADKYAVLHVRKGDVGEMLKRDLPSLASGTLDMKALRLTLSHYVSRTAPFEFYYPEIEKCIDEKLRILFTSDSPETLQHFTAKFGAKHFVDINRFIRARYPIQKAFLDFNMMIGGTKIISTGSTYAAFAAVLGGSKISSVAMTGSTETLVDFLFHEYAPDLVANLKLRQLLGEEVDAVLRAKGKKPKQVLEVPA
jgi:hypothetical protein